MSHDNDPDDYSRLLRQIDQNVLDQFRAASIPLSPLLPAPVDPREALLQARGALRRAPQPHPLEPLESYLRVADEEIYLLSRDSKVPYRLLTSRPQPPLLDRLRLRLRHRLRRILRIVRPSR